jgi:Tetratricopeptide repeat
MLPLLRVESVNTVRLSEILRFVGIFLRLDGKNKDAEVFHRREMEIRYKISGADHPDTLLSMSNLALTYRDQGRLIDAAKLQELLQKRERISGEDHPETRSIVWTTSHGRTVSKENLTKH